MNNLNLGKNILKQERGGGCKQWKLASTRMTGASLDTGSSVLQAYEERIDASLQRFELEPTFLLNCSMQSGPSDQHVHADPDSTSN